MTESYSKPRQRAEIAFGKTQSQFFARERAFEDLDAIVIARDEKTARLRKSRLAKELQDSISPPALPNAKRGSRKARPA
jgi:hypothetical protein